MSPRHRPLRRHPGRFALLLAMACCAVVPGTAAAQRLETFGIPSLKGNVDLSVVKLNKTDSLDATVLLPDGYDEHPDADWPVLYLLQGIGDNSAGWAKPGTGNVAALSKGFPGIIVMPEAGRDFLVDWWRGGARNGPNWTRYYLDEVIPAVEARYKIRPGRANHAIGGISMGGYGALLLGGQLPGYFGTIVSMSGMADSQSAESYLLLPQSIGASYESVWGPLDGPYASVNNPIRTAANVARSRIYLSTGNGVPDATIPFMASAWSAGVVIESAVLTQSVRYDSVLTSVGAPHTLRIRGGVHDWPYWRREFPKALAWNVFAPPPYTDDAAASSWVYRTMAPHGNAWGYGYKFGAPTTSAITIQRAGQILRVTGGTGTVTISPGAPDADASGNGTKPACTFTAAMPVQRVLPPGC